MSACGARASASEHTATVLMPMRLAVLMMRQAISPRLAIRIFLNIRRASVLSGAILARKRPE